MANPLNQFIINALWKLGVMDHAFAKDAKACHERLGDSNAPNHLLQQYSAAFLVYMCEKRMESSRKSLSKLNMMLKTMMQPRSLLINLYR